MKDRTRLYRLQENRIELSLVNMTIPEAIRQIDIWERRLQRSETPLQSTICKNIIFKLKGKIQNESALQ